MHVPHSLHERHLLKACNASVLKQGTDFAKRSGVRAWSGFETGSEVFFSVVQDILNTLARAIQPNEVTQAARHALNPTAPATGSFGLSSSCLPKKPHTDLQSPAPLAMSPPVASVFDQVRTAAARESAVAQEAADQHPKAACSNIAGNSGSSHTANEPLEGPSGSRSSSGNIGTSSISTVGSSKLSDRTRSDDAADDLAYSGSSDRSGSSNSSSHYSNNSSSFTGMARP